MRAARAKGRLRAPTTKGLSIYYGKVTMWSKQAQQNVEYEVPAGVMTFVETRLKPAEHKYWKHAADAWDTEPASERP